MRILVVEDDVRLARQIASALTEAIISLWPSSS
jgi:hypothetical protein